MVPSQDVCQAGLNNRVGAPICKVMIRKFQAVGIFHKMSKIGMSSLSPIIDYSIYSDGRVLSHTSEAHLVWTSIRMIALFLLTSLLIKNDFGRRCDDEEKTNGKVTGSEPVSNS
jgi:hypothetical protein